MTIKRKGEHGQWSIMQRCSKVNANKSSSEGGLRNLAARKQGAGSADTGQRRLESEANESRVVIWLQRKHPVSTCAYFRTESQQFCWDHLWNNQDLLF